MADTLASRSVVKTVYVSCPKPARSMWMKHRLKNPMCTYCPQVVTAQNTSTLIHWILHTGPIIVGVRLQLSLELSNEPKRVYVNSFFEDQSIVSSTGSFWKQVCPVILFLSSVVQNRRIPFCQDMSEWFCLMTRSHVEQLDPWWPLYHQQWSFYVTSFLKQWKIFPYPPFPKQIRQILDLSPSSSDIQNHFFGKVLEEEMVLISTARYDLAWELPSHSDHQKALW